MSEAGSRYAAGDCGFIWVDMCVGCVREGGTKDEEGRGRVRSINWMDRSTD